MKSHTRLLSLLLTLALCLPLASAQTAGAAGVDYMAASHTKSNGCPYYIMVNRTCNTVTVYGLGETGYYTEPVKAMVCSVGREGKRTPRGTFALTGKKKEWCLMLDGTYGQYSSQFSGFYLFHSICYREKSPDAMITEEYNMLGQPASMGCIRLQVADAKWIYDNCAAGTKVTIYDDTEPGALGKPATLAGEITPEWANGWDPSDSREENPWQTVLVRELALEPGITLEAGLRQQLSPAVTPEGAIYPTVTWTVADPTVASVDALGWVTGLREGETVVTAHCGALEANCAVTVTGKLLPLADLRPGTWYYGDVRYAFEKGILTANETGNFAPEGNMTRADMAQALRQMAGQSQDGDAARLENAMDWAEKAGLLLADRVEPEHAVTRLEFVEMLYRFQTGYRGKAGEPQPDLNGFPDGETLAGEERAAMSWAVGNGLLQGNSSNLLDPMGLLPRGQAATLLRRYHEKWGQESSISE